MLQSAARFVELLNTFHKGSQSHRGDRVDAPVETTHLHKSAATPASAHTGAAKRGNLPLYSYRHATAQQRAALAKRTLTLASGAAGTQAAPHYALHVYSERQQAHTQPLRSAAQAAAFTKVSVIPQTPGHHVTPGTPNSAIPNPGRTRASTAHARGRPAAFTAGGGHHY